MHPCGSHAIIGKKGGGKSFLATKLEIGVLAHTNRMTVTNLSLKPAEIRAYMAVEFPNFTDNPADRIEIIDDVRILKRFWLYRGKGWTIPDVPKEDWNKGARLDYRHAYRWKETTEDVSHRCAIEDMTKQEVRAYVESGELEMKAVRDLPPVQYIIDEIQNIFPARGFMQTSQGCLFWLSQQRKLTDDLIWISQNSDLVDKEFRDLTDDWLYITNWGRKQKWLFRLPKVMSWAKYDQRPGPGVSAMVTGSFRMDIEGIGQCYDTSAGVGIEGGLTADTKEKTPGIHWLWMVLAFCAVLFLVGKSPQIVKYAVRHFLFGGVTPAHAQATTNAPPPPVIIQTNYYPIQGGPPAQAVATAPKPPAPTNAPAKPTLTGLLVWRGVATAYLDDGTEVSSNEPGRFGGFIRSAGRIVGARIDGQPLYITPPGPGGTSGHR